MTQYEDKVIPSLFLDDGTVFMFQAPVSVGADGLRYATFGVMHLPVSASQTNSSKPPVTWTLSSDPSTWVETVKYASRAQVAIQIFWDDANPTTYHSPAGVPAGTDVVLYKLLGLTG
jgi:hypothetical protein